MWWIDSTSCHPWGSSIPFLLRSHFPRLLRANAWACSSASCWPIPVVHQTALMGDVGCRLPTVLAETFLTLCWDSVTAQSSRLALSYHRPVLYCICMLSLPMPAFSAGSFTAISSNKSLALLILSWHLLLGESKLIDFLILKGSWFGSLKKKKKKNKYKIK